MLNRLCQQLGHFFNQPDLLVEALTHRSLKSDRYNERLEYLGDAALNFVIAAALFRKNPKATEGELSRKRAHLVCSSHLAYLAQCFELGAYLFLGPSERKAGGDQRASLLADTMEAVMGAIYLDAGFSVCEKRILDWFRESLNNIELITETKDAKSCLQEYVQARRLPLPVYTILSVEGPPHRQLFRVECSLLSLKVKAIGMGTTRRQAEQQSADSLLSSLSETTLTLPE